MQFFSSSCDCQKCLQHPYHLCHCSCCHLFYHWAKLRWSASVLLNFHFCMILTSQSSVFASAFCLFVKPSSTLLIMGTREMFIGLQKVFPCSNSLFMPYGILAKDHKLNATGYLCEEHSFSFMSSSWVSPAEEELMSSWKSAPSSNVKYRHANWFIPTAPSSL